MISGSGHYQGHDLEDLVSISEGPKWVGAVKPNVLHLMHIHGRPFSSTSQALSESRFHSFYKVTNGAVINESCWWISLVLNKLVREQPHIYQQEDEIGKGSIFIPRSYPISDRSNKDEEWKNGLGIWISFDWGRGYVVASLTVCRSSLFIGSNYYN